MQTSPSPEPRQRVRRADRYHQPETQAAPDFPSFSTPSAQPVRPMPPAQPMPRVSPAPDGYMPQHTFQEPVPPRRSAPAAPAGYPPRPVRHPDAPLSQAYDVPQPAPIVRQPRAERPAPPRAETQPLPRWMTLCMVLLFILGLGLLAAQSLMDAYLATQAREREAAHQAVVAAHPLSWSQLILDYSEEYGLQPAFVAAIILNESSYRPQAQSGVGARGLMQLMEGTAKDIAKELAVPNYSFDLLWDAEVNIRFGCHYIAKLADMFGGDPVLVAAAYNAGYGNVRNWLASRDTSPDGRTIPIASIPFGDTKVYAGKVTQAYGVYDALYYHAFNPLSADSALAAASGV